MQTMVRYLSGKCVRHSLSWLSLGQCWVTGGRLSTKLADHLLLPVLQSKLAAAGNMANACGPYQGIPKSHSHIRIYVNKSPVALKAISNAFLNPAPTNSQLAPVESTLQSIHRSRSIIRVATWVFNRNRLFFPNFGKSIWIHLRQISMVACNNIQRFYSW